MHSLLARQLRRHLGPGADIPADWKPLLDAVSDAYAQADQDRAMVEHSLDTVSREMLDRYQRLEQQKASHEALSLARRRAEELALLNAAQVASLRATSPDDVLRDVIDAVAPVARVHAMAVWTPSRGGWHVAHAWHNAEVWSVALVDQWRASVRTESELEMMSSPRSGVVFRRMTTSLDTTERAVLLCAVDDDPSSLLDDALCRLLSRQLVSALREKRIEQSHHEGTALLRAITEAAQDAIVAKGRDGRYLSCNPAAVRLLGHPVERLLGHTDAELFDADVAAREATEDATVLATGKPLVVERVARVSGRDRTLLVRKAPLVDANGTATGVVGIASDVTDRAQLEHRLRHFEKMESLGLMAGGVAHDFNNLLTIILGNCSFLRDDPGDTDEQQLMLATIHDAATRAATLTRQLLTFSRREVVAPQLFPVNARIVARDAVLRGVVGERCQLALLLSSDRLDVCMDPGQFDQVVVNLVANARDAMPAGGVAQVRTAACSLDDDAASPLGVSPGEYVAISVHDEGAGMDDDVRARLFDPFFIARQRGHGMGLGMAQVYGAITAAGGALSVDSAINVGSTITVYVPRVGSVPDDVPTRERTDANSWEYGTETVLLVEDEQAVRTLARLILERAGYSVIEARHGEDALRLALMHSGAIDLLCSDVVMPVMGGPELRRRLLESRPDVRVLFMSGYSDDLSVREGVAHADFAFVPKPFAPEALLRAVRTTLDARREAAQRT